MNEDLKIVKEFITKMNEQDNRCTASPFYYSIRTSVYRASYHDDHYDRITAVKEGEVVGSGDDLDDLCSNLVEGDVISKKDLLFDGEELVDFEIKSMLEDKEIELYPEIKDCEYKGVFFTETDAKNHLKANAHHYSHDADTYVNHCWRAPELKQFFKSVGEICSVEYQRK